MKNISLIYILFIQVLCYSCGSNRVEPYSGNLVVRDEHFLDGLKKLESGDAESMPLDGNILFYTFDGVLIPRLEVIKNSYSGNYVVQSLYVDKNNKLTLAVIAPMTEDLKKRRQEINDSKGKPNLLLGKDGIAFTSKDMEGHEFTEDQKGKVIVMNFWFMACAPCIKEFPELNKLVNKYKHEKIVFLGFTTDKKEKLVPFLKKHPFSYHVMPETMEISNNYQVLACPTHVIIDKTKKITYYYTGSFDSTSIKGFEKEIDKALAN